MKFLIATIFAGVFIIIGFSITIFHERRAGGASTSMPTSVFSTQSVTTNDLRAVLHTASSTEKNLKVLIVPGHEPNFGGAEFSNIKERDVNVDLALALARYLVEDGRFEVVTTRDRDGWNPELQEYFTARKEEITEFARVQKGEMTRLIGEGKIARVNSAVPHNSAPSDVALRLYGINKWANDRKMDIIIHIHLNNDFSSREVWQPGAYSGFAIYTPERQYSNAKASTEIAQYLFKRLSRMFPVSNLPKEDTGIVEDQDLIAVGSNNSVDGVSVLVEYGYLYEPQFREPAVRALVVRELAFQTYLGLADFFGEMPAIIGPYESTLLPYQGEVNVVKKEKVADREVLLFQAALLGQGFYPPQGRTKSTCPLSGIFGPCTSTSLAMFQDAFSITGERGIIGPDTRAKLRELFQTRYR